jgi:hypothetical protein
MASAHPPRDHLHEGNRCLQSPMPLHPQIARAIQQGTVMLTAAALLIAQPAAAATPTAQTKPGSSADLKPISWQDFSQLADLSALNVCYAITQKVEYKAAGIASTAALFTLIKERHNSRVAGMPKAAEDKTVLNQWIAGNILLKSAAICPSKLPKDVLNEATRIRAAQKR